MGKLTRFLQVSATLATLTAHPVAVGRGDPIQDATWKEYSEEYQRSQLCRRDEITLWSCEVRKRQYALCSSREVTKTGGHLQYRASNNGKRLFRYPAVERPPIGAFSYHSYPNGNASIEFTNDGYRYELLGPLRDYASIVVVDPGGKETAVYCDRGSQTLQLNYTMRLMRQSGIWDE